MTDGSMRRVDGTIDLGGPPRVRVQPTAGGGVVVMSAAPTTRDGTPVPGNLAPVLWGEGARVRSGGTLLVLEWQAAPRPHRAGAAASCRLCFGRLEQDAWASVCGCDAPFHAECHALCITCPACGLPAGGQVA